MQAMHLHFMNRGFFEKKRMRAHRGILKNKVNLKCRDPAFETTLAWIKASAVNDREKPSPLMLQDLGEGVPEFKAY